MFNLSGISSLVDGTRKLANARLSYLFEYMTNQTSSYKSSNEACNEVLEQTNTKNYFARTVPAHRTTNQRNSGKRRLFKHCRYEI